MEKAQQREADIDAIAEVLFEWKFGDDSLDWTKAKATSGWRHAISEARGMAENVLASSWLDEKLGQARQSGYDAGFFHAWDE